MVLFCCWWQIFTVWDRMWQQSYYMIADHHFRILSVSFLCIFYSAATSDAGLSRCRCFLRVTAWQRWSRAAASRPTISGKCSRGTSRSACAASRRSTVSAKRRCSAPGWRSLTRSTVATRIHARRSSAWPPARLLSWSSARTSCTRCFRTSSASRSLSTSCFTKPAR